MFITGTDEHGEKIATSAAAQGRQPKDHCDLVAAEYQALWKEVLFIFLCNVSQLGHYHSAWFLDAERQESKSLHL